MIVDANIIRREVEANPYMTAKDVAYELFVSVADVKAIAKFNGLVFAVPCPISPWGTTPAPRAHGAAKLPSVSAVNIMLEREPSLTAAEFAKRYECSTSSAYKIAKEAGVRFAELKRGPKPSDRKVRALGKLVSDVYHFANDITVTYDDRGKLMPHFTGTTSQIWPRLIKSGWKGELEVLNTHCNLSRLRPRKRKRNSSTTRLIPTCRRTSHDGLHRI